MISNPMFRGSKGSRHGDHLRILIIEDDAPVRGAYRRLLEACCFEVHEAVDGAEGVRVALDIMPDVVVTDLVMPRLDGCDVARRLRAGATTRAIPIIAATGEIVRPDEEERGLFDDVLHKPFAPRDLIAAVERVQAAIDFPR
jgi:two-component system phosphate regulon response regulator PhoB